MQTIIRAVSILLCWLCVTCSTIAMAAPPPAENFGQLPRIYDAAISPDGAQVAVIQTYKGDYVVNIVDLENTAKKPRLIALGKGVKPVGVIWANDTRVLLNIWQSSKISGTPITAGFIYSLDTQAMKGKILVKPKDIFRQYNNVVIDYLKDDPDHILMAFSDEDNNNRSPDIKRVNVASGRYKTLKKGLGNVQSWYTDLRGEPRIGQGLKDKSTEEWVLRIRDAESDKWRFANDYPGLDADVDIFGFTSNPNELIIGDYAGRDTLGLYIYDLAAKAKSRKLFHNDNFDARGLVYSHDGNEVIGATFTADTTEIELFGKYKSALDRLRTKYPRYTIDWIDQSDDAGLILFKMSNAHDPGGVLMVNSKTDKLSRIGKLYPDLLPKHLGAVISVRYTARDGEKIPSYVTLPPTINDTAQLKNLPFVILPHGGPYARDQKRFDYLAQFFATRGFGVLQMNFRGSAGYGKSFKDSGRENWVLMQEDVEDGARWLLEKGYADPDRLCIAGWSYGGYAALMGALKNPDLYDCAISMAGVTDLQDIIRDMKKYRFGRISAQNFILKGFESKDDIKANSPVKLASTLDVPLFLAHGTKDQRVHFDQFKRMKSALKKSSADVTYMEFKDEDHFLSNQENRQKFFKGLEKFLNKTVGESEFAE